MFNCHVCGHNAAKSEWVSEVFNLEGRRMLMRLNRQNRVLSAL